ncbi:hypothetical protein L2E82_25240 [Cichorium intybus]|uniref:Uncharacterized protein n=1 Tax=Cichorium intybus TaxID=13427 RepID=A0ACB9E2M6_CICIN|nr:hypothetical protein L2E82_25240 [Cichorium intybus]
MDCKLTMQVGLWIFGGAINVDVVTAAILGFSVLFITGVVIWKECLAESVAWDTLTWFAALIAMAGYLNKYGLISWFGQTVVKGPSGNLAEAESAHEIAQLKYPALLFKKRLIANIEKIYGVICDNLNKELGLLLVLCIQAPQTSEGVLISGCSFEKDSQSNPWEGIVDCLKTFLNTLKENFVGASENRQFSQISTPFVWFLDKVHALTLCIALIGDGPFSQASPVRPFFYPRSSSVKPTILFSKYHLALIILKDKKDLTLMQWFLQAE